MHRADGCEHRTGRAWKYGRVAVLKRWRACRSCQGPLRSFRKVSVGVNVLRIHFVRVGFGKRVDRLRNCCKAVPPRGGETPFEIEKFKRVQLAADDLER